MQPSFHPPVALCMYAYTTSSLPRGVAEVWCQVPLCCVGLGHSKLSNTGGRTTPLLFLEGAASFSSAAFELKRASPLSGHRCAALCVWVACCELRRGVGQRDHI